MASGPNYSEEEVRAIIDRALQNESHGAASSDLSHEQLLSLGSEIGLSSEAMERAVRDVTESRQRERLEQRVIARRRSWFFNHVWLFAAVNAVLFAVDYLTTPGQWWALFSAVPWGLALLLHARFGLSRSVSPRALRSANSWASAEQTALSFELGSGRRMRVTPKAEPDARSLEAAGVAENAAIDARRAKG